MASPKYSVCTLGPSPAVNSSFTAKLESTDVMNQVPGMLREFNGPSSAPGLSNAVTKLRDDPQLYQAARDVGDAFYASHEGGVSAPTVKQINAAVHQLADNIGLENNSKPAPSQQNKNTAKSGLRM